MTEKGPKNNKIRALGKGGKNEHGRKIFQRNPPTACCHRHTSKIAANTVFISSVCLVDPETLCKTASKRTRNVSPRHLVYCKVVGRREEGQQPANCPPDKQLLKRKEIIIIHTIKVSESKNKLQHTVTTVAVVEGGSGVSATTVLKTGRSVSLNFPLRGQATQQ